MKLQLTLRKSSLFWCLQLLTLYNKCLEYFNACNWRLLLVAELVLMHRVTLPRKRPKFQEAGRCLPPCDLCPRLSEIEAISTWARDSTVAEMAGVLSASRCLRPGPSGPARRVGTIQHGGHLLGCAIDNDEEACFVQSPSNILSGLNVCCGGMGSRDEAQHSLPLVRRALPHCLGKSLSLQLRRGDEKATPGALLKERRSAGYKEAGAKGGNPENTITESGDAVWHCSSESIVYIQNSISPLDCQRINEYVTLSEDCEASGVTSSCGVCWSGIRNVAAQNRRDMRLNVQRETKRIWELPVLFLTRRVVHASTADISVIVEYAIPAPSFVPRDALDMKSFRQQLGEPISNPLPATRESTGNRTQLALGQFHKGKRDARAALIMLLAISQTQGGSSSLLLRRMKSGCLSDGAYAAGPFCCRLGYRPVHDGLHTSERGNKFDSVAHLQTHPTLFDNTYRKGKFDSRVSCSNFAVKYSWKGKNFESAILTRYGGHGADVRGQKYEQRQQEHGEEAEGGVHVFLPRLRVEAVRHALLEVLVEGALHHAEYQQLKQTTHRHSLQALNTSS
ncbi:hypothetical protein PR048_003697 [Dryococelus australis]|uniref:Uncharacterized protein n=1 Tax=Dryococelus australis TaxID=614101 RepID=A0ABQ9INX5_9NEOP|nr:hypothetical protein PR048_003697 [Dryococelus australis]